MYFRYWEESILSRSHDLTKSNLLSYPADLSAVGSHRPNVHLLFDAATQAISVGIPDRPLGILADAVAFSPEYRGHGRRRITRVIRYA